MDTGLKQIPEENGVAFNAPNDASKQFVDQMRGNATTILEQLREKATVKYTLPIPQARPENLDKLSDTLCKAREYCNHSATLISEATILLSNLESTVGYVNLMADTVVGQVLAAAPSFITVLRSADEKKSRAKAMFPQFQMLASFMAASYTEAKALLKTIQLNYDNLKQTREDVLTQLGIIKQILQMEQPVYYPSGKPVN